MEYKIDDKELKADVFISFVNRVWKVGMILRKRKRHYLRPLI